MHTQVQNSPSVQWGRVKLAIAFACLIVPGCDKGIEAGDQSRIVVNQGIDGVRFGDDEATVRRKLGPPNSVTEGDFAGLIYEYSTGPHARLSISIYAPGLVQSGAAYMTVRSPYDGRTKEGIGIGTSRSSIVQVFGEPSTKVVSDSTQSDRYESEGRFLSIAYRNDLVTSLTLGVR